MPLNKDVIVVLHLFLFVAYTVPSWYSVLFLFAGTEHHSALDKALFFRDHIKIQMIEDIRVDIRNSSRRRTREIDDQDTLELERNLDDNTATAAELTSSTSLKTFMWSGPCSAHDPGVTLVRAKTIDEARDVLRTEVVHQATILYGADSSVASSIAKKAFPNSGEASPVPPSDPPSAHSFTWYKQWNNAAFASNLIAFLDLLETQTPVVINDHEQWVMIHGGN